jgi:hypothetical protein
MARKTTRPPAPETAPPVLVIGRDDARRQLSDRLAKGEALRARSIQSDQQLKEVKDEYRLWDSYNVELLTRIFSNRAEAESYSFWGIAVIGGNSFASNLRDLKQDLDTKVGRLRSLVERLDLIPQAHDAAGGHAATATTPKPDRREAFIVHGHDEAARESVARFLERLGVRPVILHEQANKGQTVIEKFEAHSDVPFAVVLLTPDDVGASKQAQNSLQPRARQNVIFELSFPTLFHRPLVTASHRA